MIIMILIIFFLACIFAAGCLFLGITNNSFPLVYLSFFALLVIGLMLFSNGLQIESGVAETPLNSGVFLTLYTDHTTVNDSVVNLLANTFLYLPVACILLTTFFAIRS